MNDFTKKELKELHYCLAHYSNCKFTYHENMELEKKLESMIENHTDNSTISVEGNGVNIITENCNHISDGLSYLTYPVHFKCKKCGELYR